MLRCFIELKYLKEIDKIMFHCFWWHKYFPQFKKCTLSVYTKNTKQPTKKEKSPEKQNQTTWLQGAFHWQFETEGNYTFLGINKQWLYRNQNPWQNSTEDASHFTSRCIQALFFRFFFCFLMPLGLETYCVSLPQGQKEWIWHYEFLLKYRMQWKSKPRRDTSGHYIRR